MPEKKMAIKYAFWGVIVQFVIIKIFYFSTFFFNNTSNITCKILFLISGALLVVLYIIVVFTMYIEEKGLPLLINALISFSIWALFYILIIETTGTELICLKGFQRFLLYYWIVSLILYLLLPRLKPRGMVIKQFEPCGVDEKIATSITSLLYAELYRLEKLYKKNEYENSQSLAPPTMALSISIIEEFKEIKAEPLQVSYLQASVSIPQTIIHELLTWHKPKIIISGKVVNEEGKRVIVCYMNGPGYNKIFRINSHYGLHDFDKQSDENKLPDQIELLAAQIFAVYYEIEEDIPIVALRSYNEGVRAFLDSIKRPIKKNILLYDAERHFRSALQEHSGYTRAKLMLGLVYNHFALYGCAKNILTSIIRDGTDNVKSYSSLAHIMLLELEKKETVERFYVNDDNENGKFPEDYEDTWNEIKRLCDHVITLDNKNAFGFSLMSSLCYIRRKHKDAIEYAEKAHNFAKSQKDKNIIIDSLQIQTLSYSKLFLKDNNNNRYKKKAIESIDEAISLEKNDSMNYYFKGRVLIRLGDYKGAIKSFEKALTFHPDDLDVWGNILECQLKTNASPDEISKSIEHLKKCPSALSGYIIDRISNKLEISKQETAIHSFLRSCINFVADFFTLLLIKVIFRQKKKIMAYTDSSVLMESDNDEFGKQILDKLDQQDREKIYDYYKKHMCSRIDNFWKLAQLVDEKNNSQQHDWKEGQIWARIGRIYLGEGNYPSAHKAFKESINFLQKFPEEIKNQRLHSLSLLSCALGEKDTPSKEDICTDNEDPLDTFYYEAIAELRYKAKDYLNAFNNFTEAIAYSDPHWKPVKLWREQWDILPYRTERLFIRKSASQIRYAEMVRDKNVKRINLNEAIDSLQYSSGFFSFCCCSGKSTYEQATHYWFGRAYLAKGDYTRAVEEFQIASQHENDILAKFYEGVTSRTARDLPGAIKIFGDLYMTYIKGNTDEKTGKHIKPVDVKKLEDDFSQRIESECLKTFDENSKDVVDKSRKLYLDEELDCDDLKVRIELEYLALLSACKPDDDQFKEMIEEDFNKSHPELLKIQVNTDNKELELYRRAKSGIVYFHKGNYNNAIALLSSVLCHTYDLEIYEHLQMAYIQKAISCKEHEDEKRFITEAHALCDQVEEIDFAGDVFQRMKKRLESFKEMITTKDN